MGPSGSGKSTLLGLLAGLDTPTSGQVILDGEDITNLGEDDMALLRGRKIGFVFQSFFLLEGMTAVDNVANGLLYRGKSLVDRRDAAAEALHRVGLGQRLRHTPSQMSGGERQRVAIARAIVNRPSIILADEPTGNLDTHTADEVFEVMLRLSVSHGTAFVIVTHDADLAARAERVLELQDGLLRPRAA